MKRLLTLILALLMCFSLFAACDTFDYDEDEDEDDDDRKPGFSLNEKEDDEEKADDEKKEDVDPPVHQPAQVDAVGLYSNYLVNGGYEALTKDSLGGDWSSYWKVATCQIDLNDDDLTELLVVLTNEEYMGVRGYPTVSALLAIQNNEVVVLTTAEYSGGTMGGEFLYPVQDEQLGKLRIGKYGYWRAGADSYMNPTVVYDYNGAALSIHFSAEDGYYFIPTNGSTIQQIQAETDTYSVSGDEFYYWKADGRYVTEADYKAANSCYNVLHDMTVPGTTENPLNLP